MKNLATYFTIVLAVVFFAACQKELNFEAIPNNGLAVGTLKSTSGNCLPNSVKGTYIKDTVLKISNYIEVTADITAIGNYIIKSDTVAGISFIGIGTVTATGANVIKLLGEGTPTSIGTKTFTVTFGTSVCKIDVPIVLGTPPVNPNAVFTFNCTGTTFGSGVYSVNNPVGATHTVTLNVNVTNVGIYTINTGAVSNGLTYTATGTFTTLGANTVTLTASGTPVAGGSFNYTVSSGTSNCSFSINVLVIPPPPVANLDYIPQTSFSNWSNKIMATPTPNPDTTFTQVSVNSKTFGANSYKIFEQKVQGNPTDSLFFRKNGGMYYQYIDGNLGVLDNPINKEYLVLDSNLAVNATWVVNLGPNVAQGFPIDNIKIDAKILSKGTTETVQSIAYPNVIKVTYNYTAVVFGFPTPVASEERWFAKGIGIIKSDITILIQAGGTITTELKRSQIF
jgi:hypothetical protein